MELAIRNTNGMQKTLSSQIDYQEICNWTGELTEAVKAEKQGITNITIEKDTLLKSWENYLEASKKTALTYTKNIKPCLKYLQDNGITQPTKQDIKDYRDALKIDHKATTVQAYITAIKMFFSWTEEAGIYPNITRGKLKGATIDSEHKKDYLTSSQVNRVLNTIDRTTLKGKRNYAMLLLMVTTGLREISITRANIEDIVTAGDSLVLKYQGKGHEEKAAEVKITEPVEIAINEYLEARGASRGSQGPLFTSTANRNQDGRLTTKTVSITVKEYLKAAGLNSDRLTAHSLRHTAATLSLLNGSTLEEVQQLLGHASINTTMIYTHALDRAKNKSEQNITDAIFMQRQGA